jgi:hypothetical protein
VNDLKICDAKVHMQCPKYTYENSNDICESCMVGVSCVTHGSVLVSLDLEPGFWRSGPSSVRVYLCTHGAVACAGGTGDGTSDEYPYCHTGYVGPLCAVCDKDYFRSWSSTRCERCAAGESHVASMLVCFFL